MKTRFPILPAFLVILACAPGALLAANHPAYLHALSDLRAARAHLERLTGDPATNWDEHTAIKEIDAAIAVLKEAAVEDKKNLDDHPAVDTKKDYSGRLHRALELLRKARADCEKEEDNPAARELRNRAIHHINEAVRFTEDGIAALKH